jgi:hypothetical protein
VRTDERALRHACERLSTAAEGTRNATLNREAFGLGKLVASGALDELDVTTALLDAGMASGLGQRETERTIQSGLRAGMAQPMALGR